MLLQYKNAACCLSGLQCPPGEQIGRVFAYSCICPSSLGVVDRLPTTYSGVDGGAELASFVAMHGRGRLFPGSWSQVLVVLTVASLGNHIKFY